MYTLTHQKYIPETDNYSHDRIKGYTTKNEILRFLEKKSDTAYQYYVTLWSYDPDLEDEDIEDQYNGELFLLNETNIINP